MVRRGRSAAILPGVRPVDTPEARLPFPRSPPMRFSKTEIPVVSFSVVDLFFLQGR